ncbi:MAG: hypothetical protein HN465_05705, partial [Nitrospina sp.]|nr:hypothetical protein [Nitrospina sp.]
MIKTIATNFLSITIAFSNTFIATAQTNCEGMSAPAYFSLHKNRQASFTSVMDAGTMQKYKI